MNLTYPSRPLPDEENIKFNNNDDSRYDRKFGPDAFEQYGPYHRIFVGPASQKEEKKKKKKSEETRE